MKEALTESQALEVWNKINDIFINHGITPRFFHNDVDLYPMGVKIDIDTYYNYFYFEFDLDQVDSSFFTKMSLAFNHPTLKEYSVKLGKKDYLGEYWRFKVSLYIDWEKSSTNLSKYLSTPEILPSVKKLGDFYQKLDEHSLNYDEFKDLRNVFNLLEIITPEDLESRIKEFGFESSFDFVERNEAYHWEDFKYKRRISKVIGSLQGLIMSYQIIFLNVNQK